MQYVIGDPEDSHEKLAESPCFALTWRIGTCACCCANVQADIPLNKFKKYLLVLF